MKSMFIFFLETLKEDWECSFDAKVIKRKKLPSGEGDASGSSDSGELSEAGESDQVEAENIGIFFPLYTIY